MTAASVIALTPLSLIYGAVARARLSLYQSGVLIAHRIDAPVISVGNLTTGGTGKTPLVEWIARAVAGKGRRVCILTRGYARANAHRRVLVSDGERVLADARAGGDEPRLLAEQLRGLAAVVSDADRVAAARWARRHLGSEVFILDDGFQHLRLARDLNLITLDATDPFGGGRLLPGGRLREPVRELKRADAIIITRAELADDADALCAEAARLSGGRPVLKTRARTRLISRLSANEAAQGDYEVEKDSVPQPVAAFCAVGNPQSFFAHLRGEGFALCDTRRFPDHHTHTQSEIDAYTREAKRRGAQALMTTAKDAVKLRSLRFTLPCYALSITLKFDDEPQMIELIERTLHASGGVTVPDGAGKVAGGG